MAHTKTNHQNNRSETELHRLLTQRQSHLNKPDVNLFYELEAAVVIDVIRDENHPIFKNNKPKVERSTWPDEYNDPESEKEEESFDYSWIGRVKARLIHSQQQQPVETLDWITPLETGIYEYPLVNEVIVVSFYMDRAYYSRRLNSRNFINNSADYQTEHRYGMSGGVDEQKSPGSLKGARNKSNLWPDSNRYSGSGDAMGTKPYLGKYFKANNRIRPLKHFEGDTIIQSRFGSSIRFGCYEDDPKIDQGTSLGYGESYEDAFGNPMILIRNRQKVTKDLETRYQYNILENVNEDGSSIQITSGETQSKFVPTLTHEYDNVPYRRRGCVHKTFNGFDSLARSNIGIRSDIIDKELRD